MVPTEIEDLLMAMEAVRLAIHIISTLLYHQNCSNVFEHEPFVIRDGVSCTSPHLITTITDSCSNIRWLYQIYSALQLFYVMIKVDSNEKWGGSEIWTGSEASNHWAQEWDWQSRVFCILNMSFSSQNVPLFIAQQIDWRILFTFWIGNAKLFESKLFEHSSWKFDPPCLFKK